MAGVNRHIAALVHPSVRGSEIERAQHEKFIALRLALSLPFMALVPVFLLARGAPGVGDALIFAFLLAPLAGVYALSRTGRLDIAQAICVVATALFGMALALAQGGFGVASALCFLLAPLEAALGGSAALAIGAAGCSLLAILLLQFGPALGLAPLAAFAFSSGDMSVGAAAVIYGTLLSVWSIHNGEMRDRNASHSQASLHELTETLGDIVMRIDRCGAVVEVVAAPANTFRCQPSDLTGRGLFERVLISDRPAFLKALCDAARGDGVVTVEFRLRVGPMQGETPHFLWAELRAHRSLAAHRAKVDQTRPEAQDANPSGLVLAVLRDVSAARKASEAIEAAREASELASIWKDRFLANVSHELRTPLNAIIGFSEILGNAELAPKDPGRQREYAQIVNQSGQHLLSLVNGILDISKIETGNFEIEPEAFDLAGLVDFCYDMMKLKAQEKRIAVTRSCAPQLEEIVADKRACKQILLNLLSNALKFTPEGGSVSIAARPDGDFIEISVADTGIGVNAKELARLGDPFFQARSTYDRPHEGAGLGLSIVRGLVALHGGSISFESAPNEGAFVLVRLPMDCRDVATPDARTARIETLVRRGRGAKWAEIRQSRAEPGVFLAEPGQNRAEPGPSNDQVKRFA